MLIKDNRPVERVIKKETIKDIKYVPKTRLERVLKCLQDGAKKRSEIYKLIKLDEGTIRQVIREGINKGLIREITCSECKITKTLELVK